MCWFIIQKTLKRTVTIETPIELGLKLLYTFIRFLVFVFLWWQAYRSIRVWGSTCSLETLPPHEYESDVFDIVLDNSLKLVLKIQELIIVTCSVMKRPHFAKYDPNKEYRPRLPSLIPLCI